MVYMWSRYLTGHMTAFQGTVRLQGRKLLEHVEYAGTTPGLLEARAQRLICGNKLPAHVILILRQGSQFSRIVSIELRRTRNGPNDPNAWDLGEVNWFTIPSSNQPV